MTTKTKKAEEAGGDNVTKVVDMISSLSVIELAELSKSPQDKFGVSAAVPMATMAMPGAAPAAAAVAEEKTEFDVILQSSGDKKIQVIKVVRELTNLGLKEAKDLVDGAPKPVKTGVTKEEAETIKAKLVEQGAQVEIK